MAKYRTMTALTLAMLLTAAGMGMAEAAPLGPSAPEGSGSTASAAPNAADPIPAAQSEAMQRDLGLSADGVQAQLDADADAGRIEGELSSSLGEAYAGTWLPKGSTTPSVGTTDPAQAGLIAASGAEPVLVGRSLNELDQVKAALDAKTAEAANPVRSWYVDPTSNTVVVESQDAAAAAELIRSSGADASAIRTVAVNAGYEPKDVTRGGDEFRRNVSGGYVLCSIGFAVDGGFVTAGHCGANGQNVQGFNGAELGTYRGSSFPGNDYAWVQTNGNWDVQANVNMYNGSAALVSGSDEAAVGASICRSGRTTGWRCGNVRAKNVTVNYSDGPVYGMTTTSACVEGGDSGGSFISGNQAQGVTSGGSGNCSSGGDSIFQPLQPILQKYGLRLKLQGGGGGGRSIIGLANKCIDVPNSDFADGKRLQLWDCNGSGAQKWDFVGDGTVRSGGKCMDVAWANTANGTAIQLANCSGNKAQQFTLSGAGDLVSILANKCVDVTGNNSASGTPLQLWECSGNPNQKWRLG